MSYLIQIVVTDDNAEKEAGYWEDAVLQRTLAKFDEQDDAIFQAEKFAEEVAARMELAAKLCTLANELDGATRMGAGSDIPEGSRYLLMSDTLAKQIASILRGKREWTSVDRIGPIVPGIVTTRGGAS